jgi:hypothetical protein
MSYDKEHLLDFGGYNCNSSASLEEIQIEVDKYSKLGYNDFSVEIDYGYYPGEEHLSLFGRK